MKVFLTSVVTMLVATGPAVYSQSSLQLLSKGALILEQSGPCPNLIIPIKTIEGNHARK